MPTSIATLLKSVLAVLLAGALLLGWMGVIEVNWPELDRETLRAMIDGAGVWGPILIVLLMTGAIVASPIPSAPIALAAGAAYGHVTGTLIVVAGAEFGALAAFFMARILGRAPLERWLGARLDVGLLGSQDALMFAVFASRLLPFISFDMISYAAGLSALRFWRFAIATLAGILPASFFLAHLGSEAMNGDPRTAIWTASALGTFTLISVIGAILMGRRQGREKKPPEDFE